MPTERKAYDTIRDSEEQIQMCLVCKRSDCVDCIGRKIEGKKYEERKKAWQTSINPYVNALDAKVLNLYLTAACDREISEATNIPLRSVTGIRHKFNLPAIRKISFEKRKQLVDRWLKKEA